jgi:hypothetical protein
MLSGQMDLRTPNETARSAAADWPHAQVLSVPNTGHSVITADFSNCARQAARRFLRGQAVPASCRGGSSPFFALPPAPLSLNELRPARGVQGVRGRAINAVELTLFDVTVEYLSSALSGQTLDLRGGGLRGGRWSLNLNARKPVLRLKGIEYMPGVRVSGEVRRVGSRREHAILRVYGPRTPDGLLVIGPKRITGRLGGKVVVAPAPNLTASAATADVSREDLLEIARRLARRPRMR